MNQGVKTTQHQIEGIRRGRLLKRREVMHKLKFPIVNASRAEVIQLIIIFIISFAVSTLIK